MASQSCMKRHAVGSEPRTAITICKHFEFMVHVKLDMHVMWKFVCYNCYNQTMCMS